MVFWTILNAMARLGVIWATKIIYRKAFQSASVVIIMIVIIKSDNNKKKAYESKTNTFPRFGEGQNQ